MSRYGQQEGGGPLAWGLDEGLTTHCHKKTACYESLHRALDWTDSLEQCRLRKMDMRFGTWNVTTLYREGLLKIVSSEVAKYNDLAAAHEVRWDNGGSELAGDFTLSMEMEMLIIT
jgi:hypothetical protein